MDEMNTCFRVKYFNGVSGLLFGKGWYVLVYSFCFFLRVFASYDDLSLMLFSYFSFNIFEDRIVADFIC